MKLKKVTETVVFFLDKGVVISLGLSLWVLFWDSWYLWQNVVVGLGLASMVGYAIYLTVDYYKHLEKMEVLLERRKKILEDELKKYSGKVLTSHPDTDTMEK